MAVPTGNHRAGHRGDAAGNLKKIVGACAARSRRSGKVGFAVGLAGPAVSGHELVIVGGEHALRDSSLQGQALEEAIAGVRAEYEFVIRGEWEASEAAIRQVLPAQLEALPPEQHAKLGTLEEFIAEEMTRLKHWTQFFLVHDPAEDWSRIHAPVRVLLGGLDVPVTVEQDRGPLEDAHAVAPADDWTVRVFPRGNHLSRWAETGNPEEYLRLDPVIDPEVLHESSRWIREQVGGVTPRR